MIVDVWSDVVCPWCYIGKRRLEAALERFPGRDAVEVRYHSFQLDPSAPKGSDESVGASLARKYGVTPEKARAMQENVTQVAAEDGLEFVIAGTKVENTFDAHRLLHFAAEHGKQLELTERLFAANFCNGERVGDPDTLVRLAAEVGLDADAARAVMADPSRYADAVRADIATARQIGIRGVPFFVIDRKYGVSGAQPADALLAAMSRG
jgi:predicted DsbA family dithiol-disulfide isomerase